MDERLRKGGRIATGRLMDWNQLQGTEPMQGSRDQGLVLASVFAHGSSPATSVSWRRFRPELQYPLEQAEKSQKPQVLLSWPVMAPFFR